MKRHIFLALLVLLAVAPLGAQTPQGWKLRVDRSMNAEDPDAAGAIKFITMGTGFHATNPQAAVYWNPANTATGNYTLKGTFKLVKTTGNGEYFGLILGGSNIDGATEKYLYFMVNSEGNWLIKSRDGSGTSQVASSGGPSDVVKKAGPDGTSTNAPRSASGAGQDQFPGQRKSCQLDAQSWPENRRHLWHSHQPHARSTH